MPSKQPAPQDGAAANGAAPELTPEQKAKKVGYLLCCATAEMTQCMKHASRMLLAWFGSSSRPRERNGRWICRPAAAPSEDQMRRNLWHRIRTFLRRFRVLWVVNSQEAKDAQKAAKAAKAAAKAEKMKAFAAGSAKGAEKKAKAKAESDAKKVSSGASNEAHEAIRADCAGLMAHACR